MILSWFTLLVFLSATRSDVVDIWKYSPRDATGNITLSLLAFVPFTGFEPQNGQTCAAAMQFVTDIVNARTDMLLKYKIKLVAKDEGFSSYRAIHQLIEYHLSFFESNTTTQISPPIAIGPQSSVGGVGYAEVLTPLKMVGLSTGLLATRFSANRKSFPNLYRSEPPGELSVYARIRAMTTLTNWKSVALLTSTRQLDFDLAMRFFNSAPLYGINVRWFDTVLDGIVSDETVDSLKNSGLRVTVLDFGLWPYVIDVLCAAYKAGITGPRYTFVAFASSFIEPLQLPLIVSAKRPWCTRDILIEQMKYTVYIGSMPFWIENNGPTTLGYDFDEFEMLFDRYTNGSLKGRADFSRRHSCHDYALQALLTLDLAERKLSIQNKSLADSRRHPETVFAAVNESAGAIDFAGLRYGHQRYSARLEMDDEPLIAATYSAINRTLQFNYKLYAGSNVTDVKSYKMIMLRSIVWATANGSPPADQAGRVVVVDDVDDEVVGVVSTFSAITGFVQICGAVRLFILSRRQGKALLRTQSFVLSRRLIVLFGCLLLNASAVCFAVGMAGDQAASQLNTALCYLRIIFTTLGLSFIHGYIFIKLCLFYNSLQGKLALLSTAKDQHSSHRVAGSTTIKPEIAAKIYPATTAHKHAKFGFYYSTVFSGLNLIYLLVWFVYNPSKFVLASFKVHYNPQIDANVSIFVGSCVSENQMIWQLALVAIHGVLLISGLYLVFCLRRFSLVSAIIPGLKEMRSAQINSLTLFGGTILILMGFYGNPPLQQTVMSVALIIMSAVTFGIVFVPSLIASRPKESGYSSSQLSMQSVAPLD